MVFFLLIFLFLIKVNSIRAEILSAKFELFFSQEKGLLQGKAQFLFDKEGIYTFSQKGIEILEIKQGEKSLKIYPDEKEGSFKVLVRDNKNPLIIVFEKKLILKKVLLLGFMRNIFPFLISPFPLKF